MLSADEHPGIFTFLAGLIVLVMAAVGLSLLIDQRFKFSSGVREIQKELSANASELAELSSLHDDRVGRLADSGLKLRSGFAARQELGESLVSLRQRQTAMEKSRKLLRETIASLEEDFSGYRADYRRKTWAGAIGEKLGDLTVQGGRQYMQATITRVTDVGLEIRHEHGISRVQAPDLDRKLQDRFQWSDEDRRSRLNAELENQADKNQSLPAAQTEIRKGGGAIAKAIPKSAAATPARLLENHSAEDREKLEILRLQVIGWKGKVSQLSREEGDAASNSSNGRGQKSVPGSLETWEGKTARLGKQLARARTELEVAKSRLAAVAPNDRLLRRGVENP